MPVALIIAPEPPIPLSPPRKRWTRAECTALEANGMWEAQKLELIDGELISKMGKNRPHVNALVTMMLWLMNAFGSDRVNPEAPIDVAPNDNPSNEPEPDLIVLRRPTASFRTSVPVPDDLDLVVEISDTTLRFDLSVKARLYARAGIVEYWVVDLVGRRLIVHREPEAESYRSVIAYSETDKVAPLALPQNELLVSDLFLS
jgi:Uma2 family endonuclease